MFSRWRALLNAESEQSVTLLQLDIDSLAQQLESRFALKTDALDRFAARWEYLHDRRTVGIPTKSFLLPQGEAALAHSGDWPRRSAKACYARASGRNQTQTAPAALH
jgi:hypothetical protein